MGNPLRGEAGFKAAGKNYSLVFDVNVFCEIEAELDLDVDGLVEKLSGRPGFRMLRTIFCAALQPKHGRGSAADAPPMSLIQAGEIMSDAGLEEMKRVLQQALEQAMPKKKEGGDPADPPQPPTPTRRR